MIYLFQICRVELDRYSMFLVNNQVEFSLHLCINAMLTTMYIKEKTFATEKFKSGYFIDYNQVVIFI